VRVRLDGEQLRIHRQYIRIANHVARLARRNVDALRAKPQDRRYALRKPLGEIETDLGPHVFRRSGRRHVKLDDEIAAGLERPRELGRHQRRDLTRRPTEEVSLGVFSGSRHQAVVARKRIGFVQSARGRRAIDADVGVMDDAWVAGMELDPSHVGPLRHRHFDREDAEGVCLLRGKRERRVGLDDQIRFAEQPAISVFRQEGQRLRIALGRAIRRPLIDQRNFPAREQSLAGEVSDLRRHFPGRHEARARDLRDLRRAAADFIVSGERKWPGPAGAMTGDARVKHNRRDVL
jgi:hypothetical protein